MNQDAVRNLWEVPGSVWLYGFLRAGALGLPLATGAGSVGIGHLVVLPLYILLVIRRSALAWGILLVFDSLSFALLAATRSITGAAPLVLVLAGGALATLLAPSMRRWVTAERDADHAADGTAE